MKIWVVRVSKNRLDLNAQFAPRRDSALKALAVDRDRCSWSLEGLFGLYVEAHERRVSCAWKFGTSKLAQYVVWDLKTALRREKVEDVVRSIEFVFSDAMKWYRGPPSRLLADEDLFTRFVLPELAKRPKGEQAEWSGERASVARVEDSGDFFK